MKETHLYRRAVIQCAVDHSGDGVAREETTEGDTEDQPVQLMEETKLGFSSDNQPSAGVADQNVTEEKATDHGAEEEVEDDPSRDHEDLTPEDSLGDVSKDNHKKAAPPDRGKDRRRQEADGEAGGEDTGLYLVEAPGKGQVEHTQQGRRLARQGLQIERGLNYI